MALGRVQSLCCRGSRVPGPAQELTRTQIGIEFKGPQCHEAAESSPEGPWHLRPSLAHWLRRGRCLGPRKWRAGRAWVELQLLPSPGQARPRVGCWRIKEEDRPDCQLQGGEQGQNHLLCRVQSSSTRPMPEAGETQRKDPSQTGTSACSHCLYAASRVLMGKQEFAGRRGGCRLLRLPTSVAFGPHSVRQAVSLSPVSVPPRAWELSVSRWQGLSPSGALRTGQGVREGRANVGVCGEAGLGEWEGRPVPRVLPQILAREPPPPGEHLLAKPGGGWRVVRAARLFVTRHACSDPGKGPCHPPHDQRGKARPRGRQVAPHSTHQAITTPTVLPSHPQRVTAGLLWARPRAGGPGLPPSHRPLARL